MVTWVALLRAVNVSGRNRVPMAELRQVVAAAGCDDVRTHLQSGNVLFATAERDRGKLAASLELAIREAFGVDTPVIVRTGDELRALVAGHPFGDDTAQSHVAFLAADPAADGARRLAELDPGDDEVRIAGRDVYLRYPNGVSGARLTGPLLERHLGVPATVRNWRTVTWLAAA